MRLLFVGWNPSPRVGGLAVNTEQLMEQLARSGHEVAQLTGLLPALTRPAVDAIVRRAAAPVPPVREGNGPVYRFRAIVPEAAVRSVLRSFAPDAVIVSSGGAWRTAWAQRMVDAVRPVPTVLYLYDIASAGLPSTGGGGAQTVVAISQWVAAPPRARGLPVEVIVPVIQRSRYRVSTTRETVLLVNPSETKGVDVALALARARPDVPFEFVGHPTRRVRRLPTPANITYRDWTPEPSECFGRARLLLVPSRYPEAWPRVVGEAQASGIPALGADVGGMGEAVAGGGHLVSAGAGAADWRAAFASAWDDDRVYTELAAAADEEGRREELRPEVAVARLEAAVADAVSSVS